MRLVLVVSFSAIFFWFLILNKCKTVSIYSALCLVEFWGLKLPTHAQAERTYLVWLVENKCGGKATTNRKKPNDPSPYALEEWEGQETMKPSLA